MDGERRKRKLENEEESEDQQMEKFFSLIQSTKDARDRICKEKEEDQKAAMKGGVWNPTFQLEDFVDDGELDAARININLRPPEAAIAGPSSSGQERKEEAVPAVDRESPEATAAAAPLAENIENQKKSESTDNNLDLTLSL